MPVTPLRRTDAASKGSGLAARLAVRSGTHHGPTSGLAPGYVQGNLAILPKALAEDFRIFCERNPKPCPLIGMSQAGDPRVPELGEDLDIRTDLPRYRVWRNGELIAEPEDITDYWRDDLVSFVIGCSFSFEEALTQAGIELRHIARGSNVPMFRTSVRDRGRRPVPWAAGGVDAADDAGRRRTRGGRSPAASRAYTARRCRLASRSGSASPT